MEPELMKANGGEGVAEELHMFTRRRPLERFLLYESRVKYYLVGHTACRREWRMLQISRQEHSHFVCDKACYTENQMMGILSSLASAMEAHGGIKLVMKCYGFIGVIRLLRNAYLILVTHRKKVGLIAGHRVYGCRDVAYVPVVSKEYLSSMPMHQQAASEKARASGMKNNASLSGGSSTGVGGVVGGVGNPSGNSSKLKQGSAKAKAAFQEKLRNIKSVSADEKRYLRLFMGVDLCKDFYFSYTYPLWNTLQQNLLLHPQPNSNSKAATQRCPKNQRGEGLKEREREEEGKSSQEAFVGSTSGFESMFVWNVHLAKHYFQGTGMNQEDKERWIVPLIYGFFDQVKLCSFGKQLKISLVARRSRYFAGTRYLKRGINELGQVANEVETEQIVEAQLDRDLHSCKPSKGREREDLLRLSSIIQLRGSIPLYWSQETSTSLNPRPEIVIRRYDPSYSATKRHFDRLHQRYGKPVIVLNLIKSFEKRPREMILRVEFAQAVDYLNRYHYNVRSSAIRESKASEQKKNKDTGGAGTADGERERRRKGESENNAMSTSELLFVHWDFSKCTKQRGVNVLGAISPVVKSALKSTGLFYTRPVSSAHKEGSATSAAGAGAGAADEEEEESKYEWSKQQGVLRTNCIDCLDRTNVAQFAYGLYALAHQMHVLGITDTDHGHWSKEGSHDGRENLQNAAHVNNLNPRSVLATELMDLYESMGDVIALQYGGSEAHSKFFKRQKGSWEATTQSKDMMTSFRRFYSNTYTDAAKQAAINLFLGHFKPNESPAHIWDLDSDSYLPNLYYKHCYDPTKEAEWKKRNSNKSSDNVEYHEKEEEEEGEEKEGFFHVQKGSPPESSKSEEAAILTANLKRLWHQKARSDRFLTVDPRKTGQMVSIDKLLAQNPLRVSEGFCDFAPLPFKETEDDYRKNLEHFLKEASVQHTNQSKSEEWASKNVPLHFSQNNWDPIFNLKSYEDGNHIVFPSCTDRMSQQQQQQQQQQYSSVRDDVSVDGDAEIYKSYVDMKMSLGENLAMDFNLDTPSVPHNLDDISSNLLNEILMEQESEDLTASDLLWNQLQTSLFDEHGAGAADASTSTYIEAEKLYTTQLIQHFTV